MGMEATHRLQEVGLPATWDNEHNLRTSHSLRVVVPQEAVEADV